MENEELRLRLKVQSTTEDLVDNLASSLGTLKAGGIDFQIDSVLVQCDACGQKEPVNLLNIVLPPSWEELPNGDHVCGNCK